MTNTTPLPELQALEIVRRLQDITIANGYAFSASQVARSNRDGDAFEYRHLSIRVDQGGQDRLPELDCPGNPPAICWTQEFQVRCFCRNSNRAEQPDIEAGEPASVNVNTMAAAVYAAITSEATDPSMWQTMGGNATDTELGALEMFIADDGEYHGAAIAINCIYRVSETNPFEKRS